jgi:hypothetical protein
MSTGKFIKIEDFDLAWDDTTETFESLLEEIGQKFPEAFIRVEKMIGVGGGWPTVDVVLPESDFEEFMKNLGHDEDDIEYLKEWVTPL